MAIYIVDGRKTGSRYYNEDLRVLGEGCGPPVQQVLDKMCTTNGMSKGKVGEGKGGDGLRVRGGTERGQITVFSSSTRVVDVPQSAHRPALSLSGRAASVGPCAILASR